MELDNKRCSWCFVNAASHMPNKSFFLTPRLTSKKEEKERVAPVAQPSAQKQRAVSQQKPLQETSQADI